MEAMKTSRARRVSAPEVQDWSIERRRRSAEPRAGGVLTTQSDLEGEGRIEEDGSWFRAPVSAVATAETEEIDKEGKRRNIGREEALARQNVLIHLILRLYPVIAM